MNRARDLIAILAAALSATPAYAQSPPSDPIADLLARPALDLEEPDLAATGPEVDPDPTVPDRSPTLPLPPRPALTRPVFLNEADRTPEGPPTAADLAYDSRLRASAASVRAFRGPLDGGWTLLSGGRELYAFQLLDRDGAVQGAWRDLRRPAALDASGFVEQVERGEASITLRFGSGAFVTLRADGDGRWTGATEEGGRSQAVTLRRRDPYVAPASLQ